MEFFETKTAPNKGLNSVQKVVVDRIMGGPLTPYFPQIKVRGNSEVCHAVSVNDVNQR